ncbi:MAG: hypothetical protein ACXVZQ_09335 [Terriglobales bacterium]
MSLRLLYYLLWIAPVPVFVGLSALMVRRKLAKEFPIFFAFVLFQVADFVIGFSTYQVSRGTYFYAYWILAAVGMALGFGVVYEVFTNVFQPFGDLRELGTILFRWASLVLLMAAIVLAVTARPAARTQVFATILNCVRSVEIMQCGLVLLMLLCSGYLGITLRHRLFGVALGFGIIAAADLIVVTVFANFGTAAGSLVQLGKMLSYNVAAGLWFAYIYAGTVERKPTKQFARAERWNYVLATAIHPGGDSPALPLIEHAVERVWKQANGRSDKGPDTAQSPDQ